MRNDTDKLKKHFSSKGKKVKLYFISNLAKDEEAMKKGLKGNATSDINLLTGEMFCSWLGANYGEFEKSLESDIDRNILYVLEILNKEKKVRGI